MAMLAFRKEPLQSKQLITQRRKKVTFVTKCVLPEMTILPFYIFKCGFKI